MSLENEFGGNSEDPIYQQNPTDSLREAAKADPTADFNPFDRDYLERIKKLLEESAKQRAAQYPQSLSGLPPGPVFPYTAPWDDGYCPGPSVNYCPSCGRRLRPGQQGCTPYQDPYAPYYGFHYGTSGGWK